MNMACTAFPLVADELFGVMFQVSPLRAVMRAEIVAIIAYLIFLIPLYPVAYLHPYTGMNLACGHTYKHTN